MLCRTNRGKEGNDMLGKKEEKKHGHMGVKLAVVGLAVVGTVGIVKKGKAWLKEKAECVLGRNDAAAGEI